MKNLEHHRSRNKKKKKENFFYTRRAAGYAVSFLPLSCTEQSTKHRKEIRAFVPTRKMERMKNMFSVVFHARLFIMPVPIFKPER